MKNIFFLLYIIAYGFGMYWLGTRSVPRHMQSLSMPDPEFQTQHLTALLTGATSLPTQVHSGGDDLQATIAKWERAEKNLQTWCATNASTYPLESFARVAWANCAAALDALKTANPNDEATQKVCNRIMERAAARNADLLAILSKPQF